MQTQPTLPIREIYQPWQFGQSLAARLGEPVNASFWSALMPENPHRRDGVRVFWAASIDWSHHHFQRHGGVWLARLHATPQLADERDREWPRAKFTTYCGRRHRRDGVLYGGEPQDLQADLEGYGYGSESVAIFLEAAKPWWPAGVR